jgi:outer membrane lipopolysaccharide assembly protein LptE/RlpB
VDAQVLVVGDQHRLRRVAPAGGLLVVHAERLGQLRVALDRVGRGAEVPLRHQVGVDVVVGHRAVLVGSGDAIDAEPVGGGVEAE